MKESKPTEAELAAMSPAELRSLARRGEWTEHVMQACPGYAKFNLAAVPEEMAFEFLLFAQRNPQACAVTDVTEPGDCHPRLLAPEADLRTDLPKYRVYREGKLINEPTDVTKYWRDDLVAFLIGGISNIFWCLQDTNVQYRFLGDFTTNVPTIPAGRFHSAMIVSGNLFKSSYDAVRAVQISSRHPAGHGAPVHIGDPATIGINDIHRPDIFFPAPIAPQEPGEIAVFWGCGVTPAAAALEAKLPFMITHKPGHLFVSDRRPEELAIL